ncbi:MAG TPA: DinB family protein [Capsulimonadaceae bacterium]|nr:DinB family protein [Capsulimonadaceae bacterium]
MENDLVEKEKQAYVGLLCGHLEGFVYGLRKLPEDKWDWTYAPPAPTPRILASHAWQWLQCDRQHIAEPDALKHANIPEPPRDPKAMCDALAEETERWREMILGFTAEQLDSPRRQFNGDHAMTVRGFVCHMIQNTIYKHGQFATIFFALGLDGAEPYDAPFPNPIYEWLKKASAGE